MQASSVSTRSPIITKRANAQRQGRAHECRTTRPLAGILHAGLRRLAPETPTHSTRAAEDPLSEGTTGCRPLQSRRAHPSSRNGPMHSARDGRMNAARRDPWQVSSMLDSGAWHRRRPRTAREQRRTQEAGEEAIRRRERHAQRRHELRRPVARDRGAPTRGDPTRGRPRSSRTGAWRRGPRSRRTGAPTTSTRKLERCAVSRSPDSLRTPARSPRSLRYAGATRLTATCATATATGTGSCASSQRALRSSPAQIWGCLREETLKTAGGTLGREAVGTNRDHRRRTGRGSVRKAHAS